MTFFFVVDHNAERGVLIAVLSLLKAERGEEVHVYILTMRAKSKSRSFKPFSQHAADFIRSLIVADNPNSSLELIDCTENFIKEPPTANMGTRFTPYAMLRLFADELPQIPDRILYLDDDVIIRRPVDQFYTQDLTGTELVGLLDYFGRFFFHNQKKIFDYLNSGVLLLNMPEIKRTGLFKRVRHLMQVKKMFLPDQTATNILAKEKRFAPKKVQRDRQYKLQDRSVIQHFTTSFRFWPYFRTQTVKPWDVKRVHSVLHLHENDDLLNEYLKLKDQL
uniref:ArbX n=1 Tax=Lactobacillus delbrueckii TaxID=1584 RepID=O53045_9LACO|nr:ArbX [Lactobacillus delbrueckii subsp. lactis]